MAPATRLATASPVAAPRRIVLVLMEPPLPFGNAAARWYYVMVRGLAARGHRITTFTPGHEADVVRVRELFPPPHDVRLYPPVERRGPAAKLAAARRPHSYMFSPALQRDLAGELAAGFDVLHLEHVWSGWLGLGYADRALLTVQYLVDIDLADVPPRSPLDRVRRRLIARAERRLLQRYPRIATVTPRLTSRVREITGHDDVHTVPLALDLSLYPFEASPATPGNGPVVGLIGSFAWQPTFRAAVRLLTRLWPQIRRRVPTARLHLVGRHAARALRPFSPGPDVSVFDDVPEIAPHFRRADVMLYAVDRGTGMKVKVMEAFAYGTPVVTTTDGIEGLPAEDGVHAGVTDDDAGLVARTVALLERPEARRRQRLAARQLVERHCDPTRVLDLLERVYGTCG